MRAARARWKRSLLLVLFLEALLLVWVAMVFMVLLLVRDAFAAYRKGRA